MSHPEAMSALDWAMAILCNAGLLSPAKLDLCGNGAWHMVAADDGVRCGFITSADGDGTGDGGVVTLLAGVTKVAVGTDSLADAEDEEESLAGRDGGRWRFRLGLLDDDGGCGGGRDGGGGLLEDKEMPRVEVPAVRAASDWANSWAFLLGEAMFLEMARPCGSVW